MTLSSENSSPDPIEDALRTFPAAAAPDLRGAVLARLRALSPPPRFRLHWLDYAVSLVAAGTIGVSLALWQWAAAVFWPTAQYRAVFLLQQYSQAAFWPVLLGGLAALAAAVVLAIAILALVMPRLAPQDRLLHRRS
jgi:hypothetical protein